MAFSLVASFGIFFAPGVNAQIDWSADVASAGQTAATEDKLVLLHFTADWCRPCRNLERFVFPNMTVEEAVRAHVVPVKVDVDLHPDLVTEFDVQSVPFDVVVSPTGKVVLKRSSPKSADGYVKMINGLRRTLNGGADGDHIINPQTGLGYESDSAQSGGSGSFQTSQTQSSQGITQSAGHQSNSFVPSTPSFAQPDHTQPDFSDDSRNLARKSTTPGEVMRNPYADDPIETQQAVPTGTGRALATSSHGEPRSQQDVPFASGLQAGHLIDNTPVNDRSHHMPTTIPADDPRLTQPLHDPTNGNSVALHGKCPVTLVNRAQWVDGDPQFGCIHRGRTYLFVSEAGKNEFQQNPDKYSPLLAGYDPVIFHESGILVDGLEEHGVFMGRLPNQRVILFSTSESRRRFQQEPADYIESVRQAMLGTSSSTIR